MRRWEISFLIGMAAAVILGSFGAFGAECVEVRQQVLRLHVLANSDSREDQELKLLVRDAVLEGTAQLFSAGGGKDGLLDLTRDHLSEIEALAAGVIEAQGFDYAVSAQVVGMYFETRSYEGVTLPAGYYDAVRLTIGSGEGQNWWCVMFPPMCIPAASDPGALPLEERIVHLGEAPAYQPKFAIVELIEGILAK